MPKMQRSIVEETADGVNLSAWFEFDSVTRTIRVVFDLLDTGKKDDAGANLVQKAVANVFEMSGYDSEITQVLTEDQVPIDWLKMKVDEVDEWIAGFDERHLMD